MRILAFSGKKQSGKTTAVTDIVNRIQKNNRWREVGFASPLKYIVQACFGATGRNLYGSDNDKNELLKCGKSTRELLQIVGTDWFRHLDADCWVNSYKMTINSTRDDTIIVTPDVRFPNEVACVQDLGGHVIRLLRNPHKDQHESETALDELEAKTIEGKSSGWQLMGGFDAIIDNRIMTIAEQNETIWKLANERKWL